VGLTGALWLGGQRRFRESGCRRGGIQEVASCERQGKHLSVPDVQVPLSFGSRSVTGLDVSVQGIAGNSRVGSGSCRTQGRVPPMWPGGGLKPLATSRSVRSMGL
jgi:hypothetical protein